MSGVETISALPMLPRRPRDAHKGLFGHVLVVGGSRGMSGAAVLCGTAALRGGAGTAQIAVPDAIQPTVAAGQICCTTAGLTSTPAGHFGFEALPELLKLAERANVIALGPGLGAGATVSALVRGILEHTPIPMVIDADGLNAVGRLSGASVLRAGPTIVTPHPGEFGRLVGKATAEVQANRQALAVGFAATRQAVVVLKGARTIVTDGRRLFVNTTGNPGMATGGSGDVLTGLVAALLAQRMESFAAAQLGVYLHGLAGDIACVDVGEESLIASDLLHYLPAAFRSYRTGAVKEA